MIDGGTTLRVSDVVLDQASDAFRGCIAEVRRKRTKLEAKRDQKVGRTHFLMLETAPWQAGDTRRERFSCDAWTTGRHRDRVELHCEGIFHLRLDLNRKSADLQLKAKALWGYGYQTLASWLILAFHRELFDGRESRLSALDPRRVLPSARAAGWRVACVELCIDGVGLNWLRSDAANFVGRTKSGTMETRESDATSWGDSASTVAETINIARRKAPVSLCLYQKSRQIEQAKGGDRTIYAPTWKAHGWDGEEEVQRVEVRLNRWGLKIEDTASEKPRVVDLEDPLTLASRKALSIAWVYHLTAKRLVVRDSARIERCTTDPRWVVVQEWGNPPEWFKAEEWRQRREVQRGAAKRIVERAESAIAKAPLRRAVAAGGWRPELEYLELEDGLLMADSESAIRTIRAIIEQQSRITAEALTGDAAIELIEYAEHYLARYEPWLGEEFEWLFEHAREVEPAQWTFEHLTVPAFGPGIEEKRDDTEPQEDEETIT